MRDQDLSGKYKVFIGNKERGLRYTMADRETLENMFPRPDGTPGDILTLLKHLVGGGSYAVQVSLLWKGLNRVNSRVTLANVKDWLEALREKGETAAIMPIFRNVFNAVMESGITGTVIIDAYKETSDEEDEQEGAPKDRAAS